MAKQQPALRIAFDRVERKVAAFVEPLVESRRFADVTTLILRARNQVDSSVDGTRSALVHLVGLVTLRDLNRLTSSIRRIEGDLRKVVSMIEAQAEEQHRDDDPIRPRPSTDRQRAPG